jgi:hypothetical protein
MNKKNEISLTIVCRAGRIDVKSGQYFRWGFIEPQDDLHGAKWELTLIVINHSDVSLIRNNLG